MTAESFVGSLSHNLGWMGDARCRRHKRLRRQLEGFYTQPPTTAALGLCEKCPVRRECLRYAYATGTEHGWFGGLSPAKRRQLGNADTAIRWLTDEGRLRD